MSSYIESFQVKVIHPDLVKSTGSLFYFFSVAQASLLQICLWWKRQTTVWIGQWSNHPTCSFFFFVHGVAPTPPPVSCEKVRNRQRSRLDAPSLTSAVISHGCWLANNDWLSGWHSATQRPVLSALIGMRHICSSLTLAAHDRRIKGIWVS